MATTYLEAVNEILEESNEVALTTGNFSSSVGIQSYAKKIVNRAYSELCAMERRWPFLASAESNVNEPYAGNTTLETTEGTRWYLLKSGSANTTTDFADVDWDSFSVTTQGVAGATTPYEHKELAYITFDHWKDRFSEDENSDAGEGQSYGDPSRVIESQDGRYFGLSPIPNKVYGVYFTAWSQPVKLATHDDEFVVPDMYMPVVLHKARQYMLNFKKDFQEASVAEREFKQGVKMMRRFLMKNQNDYMRDDRRVY